MCGLGAVNISGSGCGHQYSSFHWKFMHQPTHACNSVLNALLTFSLRHMSIQRKASHHLLLPCEKILLITAANCTIKCLDIVKMVEKYFIFFVSVPRIYYPPPTHVVKIVAVLAAL